MAASGKKGKIIRQGNENIVIERIEGGIPRIQASNFNDLFYGLGFCHAMDRGMQMLTMKILGKGTASEHLSGDDDMLDVDIFFRGMNWSNHVDEEIAKLSKKEVDLLQAYCSGANDAFRRHKPWELNLLLGYKDFAWEIGDCLLMTRMAGFLTFAQSQGEIERLFIQLVQKGASRKLLDELFPDILNDYDESVIRKVRMTQKIVPDAVKWGINTAPMMASNNWVISGDRTESGKPILANDTHMEINRMPCIWYEAVASIDQDYVHGATLPGTATFVTARSKDLSWGITYAFMDSSDIWIEQCKDGKYMKDGEWQAFEERVEVIKRKKKADQTVTYYENEHGVLDGNPYDEGYYLSTKWSGDRCGGNSIRSMVKLLNAKSVKEGMEHAGNIELALSWVFADGKGNIGFQMSGLMPIRKEGHRGFTPLEGWKSENDWNGYHAPEDLPRSYNPQQGFITTANNDLNQYGKVSPINAPMGAYRANRIADLIKKKDKHSIQSTREIQYDVYSLEAERFMEIIRPLLPDNKNAELLRSWDLRVRSGFQRSLSV